ncbi:sigma-70 family RNA polymerase sigma factor [Bacillus thuringiensis]|uniref:sigma-70 family RNA polymerase sigma factor n=1 Tax=Bacillus thuringiensis TaxID=1428 RepID=UPI003F6A7247
MPEVVDVKGMSDSDFVKKYERFLHFFIQRRYGSKLDSIKNDTGLEIEDLVQCGMIALIKARDQFKPELGFKFLTFATPKIIGEIGHEIYKTQKVKIEKTVYYAKGKILKNKLGEESVEHISKVLEIEPKLVKAAKDYQPGAFSLDKIVYSSGSGEGEDITLERKLEDENESIESKVENKMVVHSFLNTLQDREMIVWDMHSQNKPQHEISNRAGVSQPHISRILKQINQRAAAFGKAQGVAK